MRLARQLQSSLISGTASEDWQRGKIRETQVLIGPYQGCSILESHYVPPPPGPILKSRLDSWEKWIQFFCHALTNQGHDAEILIKQLIEWSKQTNNDLRGHGIKGVAIASAEQPIEQPLVRASSLNGVTTAGTRTVLGEVAASARPDGPSDQAELFSASPGLELISRSRPTCGPTNQTPLARGN